MKKPLILAGAAIAIVGAGILANRYDQTVADRYRARLPVDQSSLVRGGRYVGQNDAVPTMRFQGTGTKRETLPLSPAR